MIAKPNGETQPLEDMSGGNLAELAFHRAPCGLSLVSAQDTTFGCYVGANPAYLALTGYDLETLRKRSIHNVVPSSHLPGVLEALEGLARGNAPPHEADLPLVHRDGTSIDVREHRSLVCGEGADPLYFLMRTEAASPNREDDAVALRDSESRYRMIADYAADMIVRTRADRTRSYVSPASKTLLGYEPREIMEVDFANLLHPDDRAWVADAYNRFLAGGERDETHAYRLRHKNESYVWVEAHWVAARKVPGDPFADNETAVIAVLRDITERKATEAQIALMACHDPLSGLANRVLFNDRLREALALVDSGGIFAVASIDLDDFKGVNDTFGHDIGDALLRAVAGRLRSCVRAGDTVARLGGDEFAIVFIDLRSPDDATTNVSRILAELVRPYEIDGERVTIGASIGVTTAPADGTNAATLLKNADLALYRAKAEGRKSFRLFEPELLSRALAKRTLENDLKRALAAGEFRVFYQPIVDFQTGEIRAFEALARWRHPERGLLAPKDFISLAEETGAIVELGEWILRDACAKATTWPARIALAVNLSPVQFEAGDFAAMIADALRVSGLNPRRLDLEITENVLFLEDDRTLATLAELRLRGIGISLDDFGTGYSSLRYIRSLKFDKLKIDRSFVMDMMHDGGCAAIVNAVIGLGQSLGIATIAEGIETPEQYRALRAKGATMGQGYLLGKPLPGDDVETFIETFRVFAPD